MARIVRSLVFLSLLITTSFSPVTAQACSTHQFPDHKTSFAACNDLPVLNSTIYWNYFPSNGTVDLAFRATLLGESRWTAWAINPSSKGMVGSQALIAFQRTDGSMAAYTSPIKGYDTRLEQGNLTFPVYTLSAVYENKEITIFASLGLPNNVTTVNQLWQQGPLHGNTPGMHPMSGPYLKSYGTLDFLSGKVEATGTHHSSVSLFKIFHGITNFVGWGLLLPIGTIVAGNMKALAPNAWFKIHMYCQISGSLVGLVGWGTGLFFPFRSHGIQHKGHFCIGTTLLLLVIPQVLLGLFRPDKEGKYRWLWKLFHGYAVGYTIIILGIVNIYKGFSILEDLGVSKLWKYGYTGFLALLVIGTGFTYLMNKNSAEKQLEQRADGNV